MLQKFQNHLLQNFQFLSGKKVLLATSGGKDSMVMVHLLQHLEYEIGIAHCNFQLRGMESFEDQRFVKEYAVDHHIPVFITQFDTKAFAEDYKISTQVAARELRYNWFYELLETEKYDYILTAHHADDNLETFLINLSRGTGLEGLIGIPEQNEKVVRPLLAFSQEEMEEYAILHGIQWREDSSNASDKYLRNKIRHHVVPLLKEVNPNFLLSFHKTQGYLQQAQDMVDDAAIIVYQQVAQPDGDTIYFDLKKLKKLPNYKSYLYQWLNEFGFKAWDDIYDLVDSQSGKFVFSSEYRLLKDRDSLLLSPLYLEDRNQEYSIVENQKEVNIPLNLTFCKVMDISIGSNKTIFVDADKLHYPLVLRHWNEGDHFQPFGMDGKSKKISKLFKDEKLSLIEKENTWLLCSNTTIVWVIGLRQDERFKIENKTKNILKIQLE
ncbi:tRNA(Ile)-lysidine synthase [Flavobacterium fryxellicola]|uniref:tRNA(Ile)-lysidine synthase n=1 Tax=Flavobacterium fryxellicola TaxID=249352 RepID=A0A167ZFD3_9FLAO|nr:tRNA lysidine(34) synthetase TilS [Flavobacterium fryxellicola]OAB30388.1 tRNA(Ile)-lysidine synthetase [Flavobacterium fryxellicola]SHN76199.1 tRNA(Ile)-lysidine synthase [Flavobacterium fryxellicola]